MKVKLGSLILSIGAGAVGFWLLSQSVVPKVASASRENSNQNLPTLQKSSIVIKKSKRQLQLFDNGKLIKVYKIALGFAPAGDKEREGDGRMPEGDFYIAVKNEKSKFYLSLGLSYPNVDDAERGLRQKIISQSEHDQIVEAVRNQKLPPQNTALGGEIYIHGGGAANDWTRGCVALENKEIKELFDALSLLTPVRIEP